MKKLVLVLAMITGFSTIYPIGHGNKMKCGEHDIATLITQIPTDQHELRAFIEAKKSFIRLCVRDMRKLMHAHPHDQQIQAFARTCNTMEAILSAVDSLALT